MNMGAPSADEIRARLRVVLHQSDLDNTTERVLANGLAEYFGSPMDAHWIVKLIKDEVTHFIGEQASQMAAAAQVPAESNPAKRDRTDGAAGPGAAKTARVSLPAGDATVAFSLDEQGLLIAKVKQYKGKMYVDLRMHWESEEEGLMPTKKGIMLSPEDWATLSASLGQLQQAQQDRDLGANVQLSGLRKVTMSDYKKKLSVDVRDYYDKGGEIAPTQKGVSLSAEHLQALIAAAPALTAAAAGATPSPKPAAAPTSAAGPKAAASSPAAAGAGPGTVMLKSGTGEALLQLGGSKFASASQFKGKWMVGLREFYQKEGSGWMPGKKGISLSMDQFNVLSANAQAISDALAAKDMTFELQLTPMRKVSINNFKGKWLVNVREYYMKGEELAPGMKGVALNPEQWAVVHANMGQIAAMAS